MWVYLNIGSWRWFWSNNRSECCWFRWFIHILILTSLEFLLFDSFLYLTNIIYFDKRDLISLNINWIPQFLAFLIWWKLLFFVFTIRSRHQCKNIIWENRIDSSNIHNMKLSWHFWYFLHQNIFFGLVFSISWFFSLVCFFWIFKAFEKFTILNIWNLISLRFTFWARALFLSFSY